MGEGIEAIERSTIVNGEAGRLFGATNIKARGGRLSAAGFSMRWM